MWYEIKEMLSSDADEGEMVLRDILPSLYQAWAYCQEMTEKILSENFPTSSQSWAKKNNRQIKALNIMVIHHKDY